jgi:hypothetical protein
LRGLHHRGQYPVAFLGRDPPFGHDADDVLRQTIDHPKHRHYLKPLSIVDLMNEAA